MSDESIFAAGARQGPLCRAAQFLDGACGSDDALRRRIELLSRQMTRPPASSSAAPTAPPTRRGEPRRRRRPLQAAAADRRGGHGHRLHGRAGEAGPPPVALKIIKPGMDSRQVIARFEAERQALAMMDHQNIARVLDAGTTESGRPYFVMELVHGVPITQFCDDDTSRPASGWSCSCRLPGHPARPSEGDHPPRHQAVQRPGDDVRRQAGAQGDRLRRGQGDRATADRTDDVHAVRGPGRHVRVHEPRAGGDERLRRGHAQRHLLAGRAALRTA